MSAVLNVYFTTFTSFYFTLSAWKDSEIGNCGSLTPTKVTALDCSKLTHCICEKKNVCLSTMRLPRPQQNEHNNFSL